MRTNLRDNEFSKIYAAFIELFPEKPWVKRISNLEHHINEMPIIRPLLWKKNILAYGLEAFGSHGKSSDPEVWEAIKQAMIFAAQIVQICDSSTPENARKFCGRVLHAINNPDGARGLRFELMVATHLSRKGCGITWMEEHRGVETFDMLAKIPGVGSIEVECKSLSVGKGESLNEDAFYALMYSLLPLLEPKLPAFEHYLYGISFTFSEKIPEVVSEREQLVSKLVEAVSAGKHQLEGICTINLRFVSLQLIENELTHDELNTLASKLLDSYAGYRLVKNLGNQGYLIIDANSLVPSKFDLALSKVAKYAVRKQMTGKRPGCLVIRVERHSGEALAAYAKDEMNLLARQATKLLCTPENTHLAAVVFVSTPSLEIISESTESEQSRTYVFDSSSEQHQRLGLARIFGVEK